MRVSAAGGVLDKGDGLGDAMDSGVAGGFWGMFDAFVLFG